MKRQKSYIKRIFYSMMLIMVMFLTMMGILIVVYTRKMIGNELIELNQSVLSQAATRTAGLLTDAAKLSNELAWDSRIVEGMATGDQSKEFSSYVEGRISDTIWKDYQKGSAFQIYFAGSAGWRYPETSNYDFASLEELYQQAGEATGQNTILLSYDFEEEEKGLYRYTFQMIQEVRDLVTGEPYGYLLTKISEKKLWEIYMSLDGVGQRFVILDQTGTIVSSRDKREIGTLFSQYDVNIGENKEKGHYISYHKTEAPLYLYEKIRGTNWYLLEEVMIQDVWRNLNRVTYMIGGGMLCGVMILFLLFLYYSKKTLKPVREIEEKMSMAAAGNFEIRAKIMQEDEFGQIASSFNTMVEKIHDQVSEIKEMEKKKRLAELDFLRAQINPHFIYNTLSSIRFYVEMNQGEKAENMLLNFSKLLRRTLSRSEDIIPLREELESIKSYVELQKMRYTDQLEIEYQMEEETLECLLPNFIIQPIIENAIFFSVGNDTVGTIWLSSFFEGDVLAIQIKDNGSGMTQEKIDQVLHKELNINKVGIRNVKERIQLIYGHKYGLWIDSCPGQGTSVRLVLPIEWE